MAETPASSYNPLFIYGDSGLGKTHLLHAIGHYVAENFPGRTVRYVSTETFMNDFVDAIRTNNQADVQAPLPGLRRAARRRHPVHGGQGGAPGGVLPHLQLALRGNSSQIVLSSDRHPRSIATLEDRLRSRFEWGLITDVQPPELETRLAILRKKAEGERAPRSPTRCSSSSPPTSRDNIRELEGALIRVTAFASLNREPLTRPMAERVLSDILAAGRPRQITPKVILEATADDVRLQHRRAVRHQPPPARWSTPARSACTSSGS